VAGGGGPGRNGVGNKIVRESLFSFFHIDVFLCLSRRFLMIM
jgi:hypothetical protein